MERSRRAVLRGSGVCAGAGLLAGCRNRVAPEDTDRVVVVGGGVAGLAAADRLAGEGYEVVLLEARDRLGGRIDTRRPWGETAVDLGASWIHGRARNPLADRARDLGVSTERTDYTNLRVYEGRRRLEWSTLERVYDRYLRLLNTADRRRERLDRDRSLRAAFADVRADWSLSPRARRRLDFTVTTEIEHEYAADTDDLSLFWYDMGDEPAGGDDLVVGGYDRVLSGLAEGVDVRLEHVVEEVWQGRAGVRVHTDRGVVPGDRAVVTLPLGVLQSGAVRFRPRLPAEKREAVDDLGPGVLNKVVLRFPGAFWPTDTELFGLVRTHSDRWAEFLNLAHYTGDPVLVAFNAGDFGRELETWPDERVVASALGALRETFGDVPAPDDALVTRWHADRFARGAYTYVPPGTGPRAVRRLARPVADRLFFAGEATSRAAPGTVHGAFASGRRAAREVMDA